MTLELVSWASCPVCQKRIVLPDCAKSGDRVSCCGRSFRLTYEFGSWALEDE